MLRGEDFCGAVIPDCIDFRDFARSVTLTDVETLDREIRKMTARLFKA